MLKTIIIIIIIMLSFYIRNSNSELVQFVL